MSAQSSLSTLSQFFHQSGLLFRCFDLGRQIKPLSNHQFQLFEQLTSPWNNPYQQHAWLGILMWNPQNTEQHSVWFLKLPLDEQNILIPAARDYLLSRILQALSEQKSGADILADNPFAFKPNQEKSAAFTALSKQTLGLSIDNTAAQAVYLREQSDYWSELSLQQVADFVFSLDKQSQGELAQGINKQNDEAIIWLTSQLEHLEIEFSLAQALVNKALTSPELWPAVLRGLANSKATGLVAEQLLALDDFKYMEDVILVLVSRAHRHLTDAKLRQFALGKLHLLFNDDNFYTLITELLTLPSIAKDLRADIKANSLISDRLARLMQQKVH